MLPIDLPRRALAPSGSYVEDTITYASRDGHTGLVARYTMSSGTRDARRPVVVFMHGYSEDADAIGQATKRRWADRGFCSVALGMRGRNGATGANDASGREILDIIDGLAAVRSSLGASVSQTRAALVGYSGGGGNTVAAMAKTPDAFSYYVDHFGMVDYGLWPGWWGTNTQFQAIIESAVGGSPAAIPNAYAARRHQEPALLNLRMAPAHVGLYAIHDPADGAVRILHSDELSFRAAELGLSAPKFSYLRDYASVGDPHGYPETVTALVDIEANYWKRCFNARPWRMPVAGRTVVAGYLITRGWEVWLADSGAADPATAATNNHRAALSWNGNAFTLTPLTGELKAKVRRGALSATGTFSTTTTLTAA